MKTAKHSTQPVLVPKSTAEITQADLTRLGDICYYLSGLQTLIHSETSETLLLERSELGAIVASLYRRLEDFFSDLNERHDKNRRENEDGGAA